MDTHELEENGQDCHQKLPHDPLSCIYGEGPSGDQRGEGSS
jgi:hypothetical protein